MSLKRNPPDAGVFSEKSLYLEMDSENFGSPIARIEKMENLDAHSADFRQFFLTHYETLCVRAFRLVHDRKLSEDIVQDVFLMLWERREEIDFSRPVLPYLMTAVRNRSIDFLRSRQVARRRDLRTRYA